MRLTVVGNSPSCENPGRASSSYLIEGQNGPLLLDCGHGAVGAVQEHVQLAGIRAIVISHMHPDHFFDLVPFRYGIVFHGLPPVPLYMPPGAFDIWKALEAPLDLQPNFLESAFQPHEYDPDGTLVLQDLEIRFALTRHFIPAFAMRVGDGDNRSLFFSSDTAMSAEVVALAREANVGLVEATLTEQRQGAAMHGHMTGTEAGELARDAQIERLLLTHVWEPIADQVVQQAAGTYAGPIDLAEAGRTYEV